VTGVLAVTLTAITAIEITAKTAMMLGRINFFNLNPFLETMGVGKTTSVSSFSQKSYVCYP